MVQGSKVQTVQEPLIRSTIGLASAKVAADPGGDQIVQTIPAFLPAVHLGKRNYAGAMT
jgi:hypothetical protein